MLYFVLSFLPIITLLICLLVIKLSAKRASLAAFLVAAAEFILWIKPGTAGMVITLEKGLAMSLFVGLIAFSAMLLYNLVDISGGFNVINRYLSGVFSDRFVMFLTIRWVFSAFLQGIAGYVCWKARSSSAGRKSCCCIAAGTFLGNKFRFDGLVHLCH